jgi:hypothetical protein
MINPLATMTLPSIVAKLLDRRGVAADRHGRRGAAELAVRAGWIRAMNKRLRCFINLCVDVIAVVMPMMIGILKRPADKA